MGHGAWGMGSKRGENGREDTGREGERRWRGRQARQARQPLISTARKYPGDHLQSAACVQAWATVMDMDMDAMQMSLARVSLNNNLTTSGLTTRGHAIAALPLLIIAQILILAAGSPAFSLLRD
jgi:hypothetical protein